MDRTEHRWGKKWCNREDVKGKLISLLLHIASSSCFLSHLQTQTIKPYGKRGVLFITTYENKTKSECRCMDLNGIYKYSVLWSVIIILWLLKWNKKHHTVIFKVFWMHVHLIFYRKKCCKGFKFVLGQCIPEGRENCLDVCICLLLFIILDFSPIMSHKVFRPLTHFTLLSLVLTSLHV